MQDILRQLRLKQLYFLLEAVAIKDIHVSQSKNYDQIIETSHAILKSFELQPSKQHTELLIRFVYYSDFSEHFMDDAFNLLTRMAEGTLPSEYELELHLLEEQSKQRFRKLRNMPKTMERSKEQSLPPAISAWRAGSDSEGCQHSEVKNSTSFRQVCRAS